MLAKHWLWGTEDVWRRSQRTSCQKPTL